MVMDILMNEDDNYMIAGKELVIESAGITVKYILQMTPLFVKKTVTCLHKSYPGRIKGIYCISAPAFFEAMFNFIKSLMPAKLKSRVSS